MIKTMEYPAEARERVLVSPGGFTPAHDQKVVLWLAGQTEGAILEIGCNEGYLTRELALEFRERVVVGLDFVPSGRQGTMCREQSGEMPPQIGLAVAREFFPRVLLLNENSRELNYAALERAVGAVGFIFIDGDHSYEGVKADTELALSYAAAVVGAGGVERSIRKVIIAWHDAYPEGPDWCGVWSYLTSLAALGVPVVRVKDSWVCFASFEREEGKEHREEERKSL